MRPPIDRTSTPAPPVFATMPTVSVGRDALFSALGRVYTEAEFEDLCFDFGIELDDVTTERQMERKELGIEGGDAGGEADDEEVLYKIDIPANRYDLLCIEGIARALRIFLGKEGIPDFRVATAGPVEEMVVKPETALVRPFVVCAVLRGCSFTKESYNSFIDLQDKLHQNLCRQRTLVAIGTHDLSTLKGPFRYEALPPEMISFVPLKQTREFTARELMEHYKSDQKLKQFLHIIEDSPVFPVIYDANNTVLSLPPIINGAHSAITLDTTDVFIECTATDVTKANVVLNTVVTMFSQYCKTAFEVEPVKVTDQFGEARVYPDLGLKAFRVSRDKVCQAIGVDLGVEQMAGLLKKMQLYVDVEGGGGEAGDFVVKAPPTRSDILHACDIYEDVAIAWGYNNIAREVPAQATVGKEQPLNQLSDLLRMELAMAGYTEILTWALCSAKENFDFLRRKDDPPTAVTIGNPKTLEFEVCRTSLLTCALKTLSANKDAPVPVKLFEVSDVVLLDDAQESGSKNERHIVAVYCSKESGFEAIHGVLNRVMEVLGVPCFLNQGDGEGPTYAWRASQDATFFPDRQAVVSYKNQDVGIFGILHPEVLKAFDIVYPCSALELNIEPFCYDQFGNALELR